MVTCEAVEKSSPRERRTAIYQNRSIDGEVVTAADPIDLAIVPLVSASCSGLRVPEHFALDVREGELCLFVGFQARPKSWEIDASRLTLRPQPLAYMGTVLKPSAERFSIRLNHKHFYRRGAKQNAVGKLNGISGAGVFVLRKDSPRLAGVVIEYQKRASEIFATTSLALLRMLKAS